MERLAREARTCTRSERLRATAVAGMASWLSADAADAARIDECTAPFRQEARKRRQDEKEYQRFDRR